MKIKFKDSFFFGACTSSMQSEGNHSEFITNWDIRFKENPEMFFNKWGPQSYTDTYYDFENEVKLYKEVGLQTFKTSVQWGRIFPKKGVISKEGINFYHNYFNEFKKHNIELFISINHFDIPDWIYENGGFENYENCDHFLEYAKLFLNEFGQYATKVSTFNEPIVPIQFGYLDVLHPPAVIDKKRAVKAAFGVILAHSKVANYFYNEYDNQYNLKFGVNINVAPVLPKDNMHYSPEDKKAADTYNLVQNYSFLDAMIKGYFSNELIQFLKDNDCLFIPEEKDLELVQKNKLDFIGINYYFPMRIQAYNDQEKRKTENFFNDIGKEYNWPDARINKSRGWEIFPEMIDEICKIIKERYDNMPFYISENGMGIQDEERFRENGVIQDEYRIAFIQEHLTALNQAMEKYDSNCLGYHLWAGIDCWCWRNSYKNRYGLIEYNLETKEKKLKKSAYWYKELNKTKEYETLNKKIEELIDCSNKK